MAKISANGATKVAERRKSLPSGGSSVVVLCSDGRILTRLVLSDGTRDAYRVAARIRKGSEQRTGKTALQIFNIYADRRGYDA